MNNRFSLAWRTRYPENHVVFIRMVNTLSEARVVNLMETALRPAGGDRYGCIFAVVIHEGRGQSWEKAVVRKDERIGARGSNSAWTHLMEPFEL